MIGGGNAAIDSARTARRLGADVTIVYRRERKDMPAIPEEIEAAEHEGAKFVFLAAPHRIVGDKNGQRARRSRRSRRKLGEFDASGRRRPVPTDEVDAHRLRHRDPGGGREGGPGLRKASGLKVKEAGTLEVDRYSLETSREQLLRRRRPHHRRLQRVERHGLSARRRPATSTSG